MDNMIFGWTTCLTYETRQHLGYDYFSRLLDEMAAHGMKRLIVMTASHYHFDPNNHGLAWPVRNPKLRPMVDRSAINANPETEFFSRIIRKAKSLGIQVMSEIKYAGMWGLLEEYPGVEFWTNSRGIPNAEVNKPADETQQKRMSMGHICHDNPEAHRFMRDQITDFLTLYPSIDGIVMEWPGYSGEGCYCSSSRKKFKEQTGKDLAEATVKERLDRQNESVRETVEDLSRLIKGTNKDILFGLYSGFSPQDRDIAGSQERRGHRIETLMNAGLDFVMPYCEGRHLQDEEQEMARVIEYLKPLECYVHCTIRRKPPADYPLPPKGPEYIERMIHWFLGYHSSHADRLQGMSFFNEVNIPDENRNAVYRTLQNQSFAQ